MSLIRVLVVGCGHMGASHAKAYHQLPGFEIVGLVSRRPESRERLSEMLGGYPTFGDYEAALKETNPDAVAISTYPDTSPLAVGQRDVISDAIDVLVHDDWERARSNTTPRSAQRASSGLVSFAKP